MRTGLLALLLMPAIARGALGQGPSALPTPLPQPFSPNGVLRPIIPIQPAIPIPRMQPLSIVPLPTPAPVLRITPLKTPSAVVAAQSQNLIKDVPIHRRWPVLQPRESVSLPGAAGAAGAGSTTTFGAGTPRTMGGASAGHAGVPDYRRPLGW